MAQLEAIMEPQNFIGRAPQQVEEFIRDTVAPILERNSGLLGIKAEIQV